MVTFLRGPRQSASLPSVAGLARAEALMLELIDVEVALRRACRLVPVNRVFEGAR